MNKSCNDKNQLHNVDNDKNHLSDNKVHPVIIEVIISENICYTSLEWRSKVILVNSLLNLPAPAPS